LFTGASCGLPTAVSEAEFELGPMLEAIIAVVVVAMAKADTKMDAASLFIQLSNH